MIKLLYFSSETLVPAPTSAYANDEAMHGEKDDPQTTGPEARGLAGGTRNNEIVVTKRYA